MTAYITRRLLIGVLILVLVTLLVFLVMRLLPGDPLSLFIAQNQTQTYTPEQIEQLRHQYGLDKSLPASIHDRGVDDHLHEHRADLAEALGRHADRFGCGCREPLRPDSRSPHQDSNPCQHGC